MLFHLPFNLIDRRLSPNVRDAPVEGVVTLDLTIEEHRKPPRPTTPWKVLAGDVTGDVTLVFFNSRPGQIEALLPLGARGIISGKMELFDGYRQIVQPDRIIEPGRGTPLPEFEPVYPLTEGLSQRLVAKTALSALEALPKLPEWQDSAWLAKNGWPSFAPALQALHRADAPADIGDESRSWRVLLMMNCSRASLLCRWCARACARAPDGRQSAPEKNPPPFAPPCPSR